MSSADVLEVAVFAPLRKTYHYLPATDPHGFAPRTGCLVRVPFGRGNRIGIIVAPARAHSVTVRQLKSITEVVERLPIVGVEMMRLAIWAAEYYQHPLGEVLAASLPGPLRHGPAPPRRQNLEWCVVKAAEHDREKLARKAPRQAALLQQIDKGPMVAEDFQAFSFDWRRAVRELEKKGLVTRRPRATTVATNIVPELPQLNAAQKSAAASLVAAFGSFRAHLLHGVTGSGKTEVYMVAMQHALDNDLNALMLVPEIILTEQMVARLRHRFGSAVSVLHSGLSDNERAQVWLRCRDGDVKILMGTRSAVWAPLPRIGIIIVDEEHDSSFKQHEGFRYSARDVATKRAQQLKVPIVLGTATPSLEAYLNVKKNKFTYLSLPQRVGVAQLPKIECLDVRGLRLTGGLSDRLVGEINECLERGEQTLLFLNRRGFAPIVLCRQCGYIAACGRCDAKLVWHKERKILICHHCGARKRTQHIQACCPAPELVPLGIGTQQVEETLNELFPGKIIARIDRDTMRRKSTMAKTLASISGGEVDILIGTQMLAKGHDFSRVTLVGIVDADSQLFSTDFRAEEKLAQTIIQVSGRAGRAELAGKVLIQTHHPHHELLQMLLRRGYDDFAEQALEERRRAALPPYVPMALIRAESPSAQMPMKFLSALAAKIKARGIKGLDIFGPIPAAMEKKAGRFRAQVMLTASTRRVLAASVKSFVEASDEVPNRRKVRWSIDIDPHDTM